MTDRELIHKLNELKTIKVAPGLWRATARERLLAMAESTADRPLAASEAFRLRLAQWRLMFAPLPLVPVVATLVLALLGAAPVTNAMKGSLPGSTLYPFKRAFERLELSVNQNPEQQGLLQLDFASRRLDELARLAPGSAEQSRNLVRDYNISLGFAQAGLRAAPVAREVASYDTKLEILSSRLGAMQVPAPAQPAYVAALQLTDRLSSEALGVLVAAHQSGSNGLLPQTLGSRLAQHIAKVEAKLDDVDNKIREFPQNETSTRVVIESKQVIVPVREAKRLAKDSLTQAKALVEKKEFTLALQKVQEGEDITVKTEAAVDKDAEEKVEGATDEVTPPTEGTQVPPVNEGSAVPKPEPTLPSSTTPPPASQ